MFEAQENMELSLFTTLKVGGPARFFITVSSFEKLQLAICFANKKGVPFKVIGGGSNILVSDQGFEGLVIKMEMKGMEFGDTRSDGNVVFKVSAGEQWDSVVEESVEQGLYGIENLSGIPGTVGAAPVQNIGSYGVELSDVVLTVEAYDSLEGKTVVLSKDECRFGYRDSIFKNSGDRFVVTSLKMELSESKGPRLDYKDLSERFQKLKVSPSPKDIRDVILKIREEKFPEYIGGAGSAGSFFKNPVLSEEEVERLRGIFPDIPSYPLAEGSFKVPLAWVLDRVLGLSGFRKGNVGLSESQPLVLVSYAGATASEIDSFVEEIESMVREASGIEIEREVVSIP